MLLNMGDSLESCLETPTALGSIAMITLGDTDT
jgi:hypothetical protein